jgi:hypothetical protein
VHGVGGAVAHCFGQQREHLPVEIALGADEGGYRLRRLGHQQPFRHRTVAQPPAVVALEVAERGERGHEGLGAERVE